MAVGRPRKKGERRKDGRLKKVKSDPRWKTAWTRVRDFKISPDQALTPLGGYLAGVLFLKGHLNADHMGRFFSFLQYAPIGGRSAPLREKVQGGRINNSHPLNQNWLELTLRLGQDITVLHDLANNQLTVSLKRLRQILNAVPMTILGYAFMNECRYYYRYSVVPHKEPKRKIRVYFMDEFVGAYRTMRAAVNAYDRRADRHFAGIDKKMGARLSSQRNASSEISPWATAATRRGVCQ